MVRIQHTRPVYNKYTLVSALWVRVPSNVQKIAMRITGRFEYDILHNASVAQWLVFQTSNLGM